MGDDDSKKGVMPAFDGVSEEMLPDKDKMYFNDYATLVQQQGMLQDHVRTSIYQFAIYENKATSVASRCWTWVPALASCHSSQPRPARRRFTR